MLILDPAYSAQRKLVRKYLALVELTALIMKQKQKQLISHYKISPQFKDKTKAKKDIVVFSDAKSVL